MNFHTRTILDILNLDTETKMVLEEIVRSEYQIHQDRIAHKKTTLNPEDSRRIRDALFNHNMRPIIRAEIVLYLKTTALQFLNSIGMSWMIREIDLDEIDYAELSACISNHVYSPL